MGRLRARPRCASSPRRAAPPGPSGSSLLSSCSTSRVRGSCHCPASPAFSAGASSRRCRASDSTRQRARGGRIFRASTLATAPPPSPRPTSGTSPPGGARPPSTSPRESTRRTLSSPSQPRRASPSACAGRTGPCAARRVPRNAARRAARRGSARVSSRSSTRSPTRRSSAPSLARPSTRSASPRAPPPARPSTWCTRRCSRRSRRS
mmetsp:Transcript_50318/g.166617  ORF Transcript_50318/g.166617 Transcript_50318/m.166617 type:complete len:207 (+) Transcript_50318:553-1173(+)